MADLSKIKQLAQELLSCVESYEAGEPGAKAEGKEVEDDQAAQGDDSEMGASLKMKMKKYV